MNIAKLIDHTLLKAEATEEAIVTLCQEAKHFQFMSVCVNASYVPLCAKLLKGSGVKVCTVVGFPLGATTAETKAFETAQAVLNGADEIDMVINVAKTKARDASYVRKEIEGVVQAAQGRIVKVILETCLLTDEEKVWACEQVVAAKAHFVKTSTGFSTGGATVADIALMRRTVGPHFGVKASGGVRTPDDVTAMVAAGATRIGTSSGPKLVQGQQSTTAY